MAILGRQSAREPGREKKEDGGDWRVMKMVLLMNETKKLLELTEREREGETERERQREKRRQSGRLRQRGRDSDSALLFFFKEVMTL